MHLKLPDAHKLDNPAWYALSETHQALCVDFGGIKCYPPLYSSFGGFSEQVNDISTTAYLNAAKGNFYFIGDEPLLPPSFHIKKELVCLQMIISNKIDTVFKETIVTLDESHTEALFLLQNDVQPGYFKPKTILLGNYYGIFKDNQLVASSGERMQMNAFTEVSGVVTHPLHTGKGYAAQLVAYTVNNILDQNKNACLHVLENNTSAIALYKKLGFTTRRKISCWQIAAVSA